MTNVEVTNLSYLFLQDEAARKESLRSAKLQSESESSSDDQLRIVSVISEMADLLGPLQIDLGIFKDVVRSERYDVEKCIERYFQMIENDDEIDGNSSSDNYSVSNDFFTTEALSEVRVNNDVHIGGSSIEDRSSSNRSGSCSSSSSSNSSPELNRVTMTSSDRSDRCPYSESIVKSTSNRPVRIRQGPSADSTEEIRQSLRSLGNVPSDESYRKEHSSDVIHSDDFSSIEQEKRHLDFTMNFTDINDDDRQFEVEKNVIGGGRGERGGANIISSQDEFHSPYDQTGSTSTSTDDTEKVKEFKNDLENNDISVSNKEKNKNVFLNIFDGLIDMINLKEYWEICWKNVMELEFRRKNENTLIKSEQPKNDVDGVSEEGDNDSYNDNNNSNRNNNGDNHNNQIHDDNVNQGTKEDSIDAISLLALDRAISMALSQLDDEEKEEREEEECWYYEDRVGDRGVEGGVENEVGAIDYTSAIDNNHNNLDMDNFNWQQHGYDNGQFDENFYFDEKINFDLIAKLTSMDEENYENLKCEKKLSTQESMLKLVKNVFGNHNCEYSDRLILRVLKECDYNVEMSVDYLISSSQSNGPLSRTENKNKNSNNLNGSIYKDHYNSNYYKNYDIKNDKFVDSNISYAAMLSDTNTENNFHSNSNRTYSADAYDNNHYKHKNHHVDKNNDIFSDDYLTENHDSHGNTVHNNSNPNNGFKFDLSGFLTQNHGSHDNNNGTNNTSRSDLSALCNDENYGNNENYTDGNSNVINGTINHNNINNSKNGNISYNNIIHKNKNIDDKTNLKTSQNTQNNVQKSTNNNSNGKSLQWRLVASKESAKMRNSLLREHSKNVPQISTAQGKL